MSASVVISPAPVVIGQPWHVSISGLKKGQDKIYLQNVRVGEDAVIPGWYHTADADGKLELDPPPLALLPDDIDGISATIKVFEAMGGPPNSPPNKKLLSEQVYQIEVP